MASLPFDDRVGSAVAELIEARTPISHHQLGGHFRAAGLARADLPGEGKKKRARAVLRAAEHNRAAGAALVRRLLGALGAEGCFRPDSSTYFGAERCRNLRAVLGQHGWSVDDDGVLRPRVLEGLEGTELSEALEQIVRRAQTGATDAALGVGTGKDLLETTARKVLVDHTGAFPTYANFPATLYQAFDRLGLPAPPPQAVADLRQALDPDPRRRFVQVLYILGCTVNELRNAQGTGHGRPFPPTITDPEAKAAVQSMGLVADFLLGQP